VALGGPALLAACSNGATRGAGTVRVINQPLMIDDNTPGLFERSSGVFLNYTEYTDAATFVAQHRSALAAHRDVGADVLVLPDAQTAQLVEAGWVRAIDAAGPRSRLLPQFANPGFDPGRKFSIPYASTMIGLVYDGGRQPRGVNSVNVLFDPALAGKVVLSVDPASTLGLVVFAAGHDPATVTAAQAEAAVARVHAAVASGQVRAFAAAQGMQGIDAVTGGGALVALARSADVRNAKIITPELDFVVPIEGAMLSSSNMVVPLGVRNLDGARIFVDYMSEPDPNSRLGSFANALLPIAGAFGALQSIDTKASADPLVQPPTGVWARLRIWGGNAATAAAEADFAKLAAAHPA
jgi:spermidine/putrescine transport system substrate-binding protein